MGLNRKRISYFFIRHKNRCKSKYVRIKKAVKTVKLTELVKIAILTYIAYRLG